MLRIDVSTLINRPVQEVWDFFTDFRNASHWIQSGSQVRLTSAGPLGVGTTFEVFRRVLGRDLTSQRHVVTQYEPGHIINTTAAIPLLGHVEGGWTFESLSGGTRMSWRSELGLGRAERLLGPAFARLVRRSQRPELSNIKRLIEARPAASPLAAIAGQPGQP
jgi:uncharacterized protein YndB with AHSA1/START domain